MRHESADPIGEGGSSAPSAAPAGDAQPSVMVPAKPETGASGSIGPPPAPERKPMRLPPLTVSKAAQTSTTLSLSIALRRQRRADTTEPILVSYLDGLIALEEGDAHAALQLLRSVVERDAKWEYGSAKVLACLLSLQLGDPDSFAALKDACFANNPPDAFASRVVSASTLRLSLDASPVSATFPGVLAKPLLAAQFAIGGSLLTYGRLAEAATALEDVARVLTGASASDTAAGPQRLVLLGDLMGGTQSPLAFPLGLATDGSLVTVDIARQPHVLIAGMTGSGKTSTLNSMLCSLLCSFTPDDLALILIDPKQAELTPYEGLPHLLAPVADDVDSALDRLRGLVEMMGNRSRVMQIFGARSLPELNVKLKAAGHKRYPYVVCVVDELADLMMASRKAAESRIVRLVQNGSAPGIHMVLATHSPRDCFTQRMKTGVSSRIAFRLSSVADSRAFLGRDGAEELLGEGDMMYQPSGNSPPTRLQGCLASSGAIAHVCGHWRAQVRSSDPPADVSDARVEVKWNLPSRADAFAFEEPRQLDERLPPTGIDETLCWIYTQVGQHDRVFDVVSRQPSPRLNMWKAAALASQGLSDAALVVYDDCIRDSDDREFASEVRYAKAGLLLDNGNEASARRELARLYADAPGFGDPDGLLAKLDASRPTGGREPIPEAIRHAVWRRDEGRCVQCGSQDSLEFDHVIPLSRGGANTERNLQLLCERCNRQKGAAV